MNAADVLAGRAQWAIEQGDVLDRLAALPDESVNAVVTSPPYWGLRDYGTASWEGGDPSCGHVAVDKPRNDTTNGDTGGHFAVGSRGTQPAKEYRQQFRSICGKCGAVRVDQQIGLEPTPDAYVARMVAVFAEVRRVLRSDGTCWVNLGDSYAGSWGAQSREGYAEGGQLEGGSMLSARQIAAHPKGQTGTGSLKNTPGLKNKDLCGIPWRVAFALQADGWWLRSDVVWAKPNPMPESVTDRPTRSHEYLFLLSKSPRYFYDSAAIREGVVAAVERPNRQDERVVLGHNGRLQEALSEGLRMPVATPADAHRLFLLCVRIATAILDLSGREQEVGLTTLDPQVRQQNGHGAGGVALTDGPVPPAATRLAVRFVEADLAPKHFLRELNGLGLALADGQDLDVPGRLPFGLVPFVVPDGDAAVRVDDAGEVRDRSLIHTNSIPDGNTVGRNKRTVWNIATEPFPLAHFAVMPTALVEPCILAGCPVGGLVLDPFVGSGTVVLEALRHGRRGIGFDLSPAYVAMARRRVEGDCPLFNTEAAS
jgi:DNA modification methylase